MKLWKRQQYSRILPCLVATLALWLPATSHSSGWVGETFEGSPCRGDSPNFGPFDYLMRDGLKDKLSIVEHYHFNADVESLRRGQTSVSPTGDLDYTLRAWPNHHRALYSIVRYRMDRLDQRRHTQFPPAECYLHKAIAFSPKDPVPLMLMAMLQQKRTELETAKEFYKKALALDPQNMQILYNYGLLLVDLGEYGEAKNIAKTVYQSKFPLAGLKNKLIREGQWQEE